MAVNLTCAIMLLTISLEVPHVALIALIGVEWHHAVPWYCLASVATLHDSPFFPALPC